MVIKRGVVENSGGVQESGSGLWDGPFGAPAAPTMDTQVAAPMVETPSFSEPVVNAPVGIVLETEIAAAAHGNAAIAHDINNIIARIQQDPNIDIATLGITDPSVYKIAEDAKERALETSVTAKRENDRSLEMIGAALTGVATASVAMGSADVIHIFPGLTAEDSIRIKNEFAPVADQLKQYDGQGKNLTLTQALEGVGVDEIALPDLPTRELPVPTKEAPGMMRSLKNA